MGFDHKTYTGLGKQILGGHKQNLVCIRTQEKGALMPQEADPRLACECLGVSSRGMIGGGLLQGWGTECSSACMGPFEGGHH